MIYGGIIYLCRNRWPKFKFWTRLFTFHMTLIPLGKGMNPTLFYQLWVHMRHIRLINLTIPPRLLVTSTS